MGLFGDDERQDQRLDALESHIRELTEAVHRNQVDTAACWADLLRLQAQVDQKISASDVDPALTNLNEDLREARKVLDQSAKDGFGELGELPAGSEPVARESAEEHE